jgi:thioredoxin reductase (NADPH)
MIDVAEIAGFPIFADAPPAAVELASRYAADVHVAAGEYLVHEGEVCSFYVLLSGKLELTKRLRDIERVLIPREAPGDYFGEIPILLGATAFCNLRAVTAARVMCLEPQTFRELLSAAPTLAATVFASVQERLSGVQAFAAEAPPPGVTVVGRCLEPESHVIRDFLARAHIAFEFVARHDPAADAVIGDIAGPEDPGPFVRIADGKLMVRPSIREIAEAAGLNVRPQAGDYDVAIVGGGPAGLAAAVYGASEGLRTVLFERDSPGGQAGTSSRIENYLGFPTGLSGDDLATRAIAQATRFGAELVVTRTVTGLDLGNGVHRVLLDGGDSISARAIVLANGVSWRTLAIEGIDRFVGAGVFYGAARTEALAVRGEDIYLIGGGNSAGQAAMFFASYARTVTLVVRGDDLARTMSDYLIKQLHTKDNIRYELSSEVVGAYGKQHLEAIDVLDRTSGARSRRETIAVFVFIGADAETAWLPQRIIRDARGYILTGREMQCAARDSAPWAEDRDPFFLETSVPGVFAAGDARAFSVKRCAAGVGEGSMAIAFTHQYLETAALQVR